MKTRRTQSSRLVALPMTSKRPRQLPVDPEVTGVQDQSQSPFMGLSSELRNRIYELAFDVTCEVPSGHKGNPKGLTAPPGLLLACKQTYAEGLKTYYSTAKFRIHTMSRTLAFLSRVASKNGHGPVLTSVTLVHEEIRRLWAALHVSYAITDFRRPYFADGGKKVFQKFAGKQVVLNAKLQPGVLKMEQLVNIVRRGSGILDKQFYIGTWTMQDGKPVPAGES
ncbi:hypothetical protein AC578_3504 [Pseudocercospora eumusae]|uniref:Uncharacterized protein n=1 Tax=Pseudocercospora eumusae TaxID=321146 RepID=A0A139H9I4_9PEZI|nr:hypothetical protein AC578_3504 [Pseudocercospora eumusae]